MIAPHRPKVVISAPSFGHTGGDATGLLLEAGCEIVSNPTDATLTEEAMAGLVGDADAIIAGMESITARVLGAAPRLKIVARRGVGYETVDLDAATRAGVPVTITAGALTDTVADHTMALLLAVVRKIPSLDRDLKAGKWDRVPTVDVCGKTLGILGFGAIGRAVARRAVGFGMRLLASDLLPDEAAAATLGVTFTDLDTLLAESDILTIHVPVTPQTRGMIGGEALRRMKPTAYLINTSRGAVLDETALLSALREGRLAGAGLDVFRDEPIQDLSLAGLDQVVATPHVASHTAETLARIERSCADAVLTALRGERPPHVVNPQVYERGPS